MNTQTFLGGIINSSAIASQENVGIDLSTVTIFGSSSAGGGITEHRYDIRGAGRH